MLVTLDILKYSSRIMISDWLISPYNLENVRSKIIVVFEWEWDKRKPEDDGIRTPFCLFRMKQ